MRRTCAVVVVCGAAALAACGDVYVDASASAVHASGGPVGVPGDTIPRNAVVICPEQRPDENSPCSSAGSTCEYGSNPDMACNVTLSCEGDTATATAAWTARPSKSCSLHDCPKGPIASLDGEPCDLPSDGDGGAPSSADELLCPMNDGLCACTTGPDAAHQHPRMWVCVQPPGGCPVDRPLSGQACGSPIACDYGSCLFKRGVRMECNNVWLSGGSATCN